MTRAGRRIFEIVADAVMLRMVLVAERVGLLMQLERAGTAGLDLQRFGSRRGLDVDRLLGLGDYLVRRDLCRWVKNRPGRSLRLASSGRDLIEAGIVGYAAFIEGAYGNVLSNSDKLILRNAEYGTGVKRDEASLATASRLVGRTQLHGSYRALLKEVKELGVKADCVADVGCGSGHFLLELLRTTGARVGLGIDASGDACRVARATVRAARAQKEGLARVRIVKADAGQPGPALARSYGKLDLVTCLFVLHFFALGETLAAERVSAVANLLRSDGGRLLVLDKHTDVLSDSGSGVPYFTEFKVIHDLTGQSLYARREWLRIFRAAGLEVLREVSLPKHTGSILFICAPQRG